MPRFKKKPVVVEAFRMGIDQRPDWFTERVTCGTITTYSDEPSGGPFEHRKTYCDIKTLEGTMRGDYGDYIIKGIQGEIYPCKPDIFEATYEPA